LDISLGPHTARIRSAIEGGGWCPKSLIDSQSEEYLQINFLNLTVITLIETQGRHGPFQEDYVDYYRLEYRRDPTHPWIKYRDFRKKEIFYGNSNNNIAEIREIAQPIIAKQFRVYPIQSNDKKAKRMCLRLELYGCLSTDHLISYTIPQGDRRSFDMDFSDKTYDGFGSPLANGLGQLIDGDTGSDDVRIDTQSWGLRGFEWVGWKKTIKNRTSIKLKFYFDSIRNFSEIHFHTNNLFTKDIEQFRRINITTYLNENFPANKQILIELSDDRQSEQARWINIPIKEQLAKIIFIELTFGNANWMLISEIQFISNQITDIKLLEQLNGKNKFILFKI
jgi:discoidin domain receptor family protein 2